MRAGQPTLTLRGESIHAVQLPEAEIFVSPDLAIKVELPNIHATGNVHVPRARIEISQLPQAAIAPSPDAIVHGGDTAREVRGLHAHVRHLADARRRRGVSRLGPHDQGHRASCACAWMRTASVAATGSLVLTGTYDAYGTDARARTRAAALQRARSTSRRSTSAPCARSRAGVRHARSRSGARGHREGAAHASVLRAARERGRRAVVLAVRPADDERRRRGAGTLQTAALTMGLQQALPAVQRIGQSLGLDEFTVQST